MMEKKQSKKRVLKLNDIDKRVISAYLSEESEVLQNSVLEASRIKKAMDFRRIEEN